MCTEAQIAAYVDDVKLAPNRRDLLVKLLPEQHPIYSGRSTNATVRMRGHTWPPSSRSGYLQPALPYVLDAFQNGRDAYLVAAAARALRGVDLPTEHLAPYLMAAIANVRYHDDALSFVRGPVRSGRWSGTPPPSTRSLRPWAGWACTPGSTLPDLEALAAAPEALSASSQAALAGVIARLRALADAADVAAPADACCTPAAITPGTGCCSSVPAVAAEACCSTSPPGPAVRTRATSVRAANDACCQGETNGPSRPLHRPL